jgi:PAS domain S-box-containing protein
MLRWVCEKHGAGCQAGTIDTGRRKSNDSILKERPAKTMNESPDRLTPLDKPGRFISGRSLEIFSGLGTLTILYLISLQSYLLFHTLVELFSIAIGVTLFIIAWNVRRTITDHYILFLGIAYLFVAVLDTFHTLSYKGMGVMATAGANTATQLWIAARYLQAASLLAAPFFLKRRINSEATFFLFSVTTALILGSIYVWNIFPTCYREGTGLTPFKVVSEYIISSGILAALILLHRNRTSFDRTVLRWIAASIVATIASELAFTFYVGVYDLSNLIGHVFRIIAFYLFYKAVVETGLRKPYEILFRNLIGQQEALRQEKKRAQGYLDVAGIIVVINPDQTIALINKAGCQTLGYEEREVVGQNWFDTFIPATVRDETKATFAQLIAGNSEGTALYEHPILTSSGEGRTICWHNRPLQDDHGRITGILSAGEDITEWKKAEAEKTHLASFPRLNPNPVVEVDLAGKVHFLNPAAERLFPDLGRLGPGHPWLKGWEAWVGDFLGNRSGEGRREIAVGDRWYNQAMYLVPEIPRIRIYGLDITHRVRTDEQLLKIHEELEERVRERTSEIDMANQRLTSEIEQRERAQRGLKEQSRLLEAFFKHSLTPIVFLDRDFNFIRVNEAYAVSCQRDASDFTGHNHFEFYPSDTKAIFHWVLETKKAYQAFAMPFSLPDHPECVASYWDWALVPILDDAGEVDFLVYALNDVTERKLAEEEARKHAQLLDLANDPIIVCTIEGDVTYWNRGAEQLYGWSKQEAIGWNIHAFLQTEPAERIEDVQEVFFRDGYWEGEIVHSKKDGTKVTVLSRWTLQRDEGNVPVAFSEINRDITELKRKEKELRDSSRYSRNLIEASLDSLVTIDADGKIMDVSRATELVTGVERQQLIGSDFSDYFTDPQKAREGYRTAFSEGYVRDYPLAIRHVSGRTTEVLYNATVYRDETGKVQGVFAAARDVTELRAAQRALQRSHDELERRVEERTAELAAANRELESFSYSVSHDLQTPLRAIDGYSRMILRDHGDLFDADTRQKFATIRVNAQMMGQLINDLLAFSHLGRKEITLSKLDMEGLLDDAWQELQIVHTERKLNLDVRAMPPAFGDRTLIKQVLVNLLSNAIKFTKYRDCAKIEAGGYADGNQVTYYVIDNGVGFDMAYHDKMFGVFQRLHNHSEFEGTGVGLAIVQRIIHRHGGQVWAEGKPDQGASFYFSLQEQKESTTS